MNDPEHLAGTTAEAADSGPPAPPDPTEQAAVRRTRRAVRADILVKRYVMGSLAFAALPVPFAPFWDMAAIAALQVKMVHGLCRLYGVPFRKELVRGLVGALAGHLFLRGSVAPAVHYLRMIPGLGQFHDLTSFIGSFAVTAASTYAIGKVFMEHFETGGTLLDFDPERVKARFQALYAEGRRLATA
jgi:uncharacterized protein (DUF697 family)